MRLYNVEINALNNALSGVKGEVYLFGSRVDDDKKGGDIDILILTQDNSFKTSHEVSVKFFMECEEKIDVVVMNPKNLKPEQEAFLKVISKVKFR